MMEDNFRRGLELAGGSALPFFIRPISVVLIALTLTSILSRTPFPNWTRRQIRHLRAVQGVR
jgi:TctA family transporter